MFSESCSTEETAKLLQSKYQSEMTNDGFHFLSELRRWYNFWKDKVEHQQNQPYSFIQTLEFPDLDFFPNICRLLLIWAVITHWIHGRRESCVWYTKFKNCLSQHIDWSVREWLESTSNVTNNDSQCSSCFIKQYPRKPFNPTMFSKWNILFLFNSDRNWCPSLFDLTPALIYPVWVPVHLLPVFYV